MKKDSRWTVSPKWVCVMEGEQVEQGEGEEEQFAESLKAGDDHVAKIVAGDDHVAKIVEKRKAEEHSGKETEDEVAEDEELHQEDHEPGRRRTRPMLDPKLPSETEVQQHCLAHMPFRNWCPHCARGRGREMDHKKKWENEEPTVPEYHMDYCFPGDEDGQKLTILVVIERRAKMKKAIVVPSKGSIGRYAARMVMELIGECGDKDQAIIVKTDQEPAIKFLVDDICTARTGARTMSEQAPKRSKGSNGIVERAVQSVEQYLRTLKSALDERVGVRIDTKHPVLTWLCEYAGCAMNRLEVSSDGKTP
jgi:hypothetical protein